MIAATSPHPLARELHEIGSTLPEAKQAELAGIAHRILRLADLALSIEREVGFFRDIENDRKRRREVVEAIDTELAAKTDGNVIEFGRRT